ncbi:MAG: 2-oxoglutarate dehydrogenase complex dihydrolipoyllysine-residue succinyltransferase [Planctomycetia bacterium]|nr:2-oxoglutarate dehydrogenase complex dihydrolipoyllysine-residue succinyltransferase [Planctomycetia bacterium]
MPLELKVPQVGESITEVQIGAWLVRVGEPVKKDAPLVEIESDKATVELPAPADGTVSKVLKQRGDMARVGEVIAYMEADGAATGAAVLSAAAPTADAGESRPAEERLSASTATPAKPQAEAQREVAATAPSEETPAPPKQAPVAPKAVPAAPREAPKAAAPASAPQRPTARPAPMQPRSRVSEVEMPGAHPSTRARGHERADGAPSASQDEAGREEEVVPMSLLRRRIAERLVEAQQTAALLTTFNEIDMSAVMQLRTDNREQFLAEYGAKLGFMSFFVKAVVQALKQVPVVNAEVRGTDIVYRNYFDIGIAVGGGKGLVVPVLRNAERMSFAEIERAIADFSDRAQKNQLKPEELQGGTFTISNGGVYGSLLSTPIVNPPQSAILGLHAIQERPVARAGQVVIRPMMYVALTYDHRVVDGREAVTFLKKVKEHVEEPARILLEL